MSTPLYRSTVSPYRWGGATHQASARYPMLKAVQGADPCPSALRTRRAQAGANRYKMVPTVGVEPTTFGLQDRCTAVVLGRRYVG